jgi:hypothetical protein
MLSTDPYSLQSPGWLAVDCGVISNVWLLALAGSCVPLVTSAVAPSLSFSSSPPWCTPSPVMTLALESAELLMVGDRSSTSSGPGSASALPSFLAEICPVEWELNNLVHRPQDGLTWSHFTLENWHRTQERGFVPRVLSSLSGRW